MRNPPDAFLVKTVYEAPDVNDLILRRLEHFRYKVDEHVRSIMNADPKAFKSGFGIWDYAAWGLRFTGRRDDTYYLDPDIPQKFWDRTGIAQLEQKSQNLYKRDEVSIKEAWARYCEQVFPQAIGMIPLQRSPYKDFRDKNFDFAPILFDEAVVFPYPNYAYIPLVSWGAYKAYVTIFYHGDLPHYRPLKIVPSLETAWEHFEAQLCERVFYEAHLIFQLDIPRSVLLAMLSLYRPVAAWIDWGGQRTILKLKPDGKGGYFYFLEESWSRTDLLQPTPSPLGAIDNIEVTPGVKPTDAVILPEGMDTEKWYFVHISAREVFGNYNLNIVVPFACTEIQFDKHLARKWLMLGEKLRYLFDHAMTVRSWSVKAKRSYMSSAVAAIMGRNMSHNLGSHAVGYVAEQLNRGERLGKGDKIRDTDVAAFLRYLQQRMDFIAQVSTSSPSWCFTLKWNSPVSEDYSNDYAIIENFKQQGCLLNNIARSDNIVYYARSGKGRLSISTGNLDKSMWVDIPHGQIGVHAFYSIIENLIRNTAKYGDKKVAERNLDLMISIEPVNNWRNDYYRVTIQDNQLAEVGTSKKLNGFLAEPIIDLHTAELKPGRWGMKEIKICAAYLRMVRQDEIDIKYVAWQSPSNQEPPMIIVKPVPNEETQKGHEGNLLYEFYLLRPKEVLIVGCPEPEATIHEHFNQAGIEFVSLEYLRERIDGGIPLRHRILVINALYMDWKWLSSRLTSLPCRICVTGIDNIPSEALSPNELSEMRRVIEFIPKMHINASPSALLIHLWSEWVTRRYGAFEMVVRFETEYWLGQEKREWRIDGLVRFTRESFDETVENACVYDHRKNVDVAGPSDNPTPGYILYKDAIFHEGFESGSPVRNLLEPILAEMNMDSNQVSSEAALALWKVKEASAVRIAIIDERVFDKRNEERSGMGTGKYSEQLTFEQAWRKRRVDLLNHMDALQDFLSFVQKQEIKVGEGGLYDFLVVHQSVLDKIREKEIKPGDFGTGWERLKNCARYTVIDTGSGKPQMAREQELRSVEFSNLSEAVFRGSKFDLVSLLFALQAEKINEEFDATDNYRNR